MSTFLFEEKREINPRLFNVGLDIPADAASQQQVRNISESSIPCYATDRGVYNILCHLFHRPWMRCGDELSIRL